MMKQQGFTLIELIVVIVILSILAATALPKFADMQVDARLAKIAGARGAISSAAALAHSTQLTAGSASNIAVTMEGLTISMVYGYPTTSGVWIAANLVDFVSAVSGTGISIAVDSGHTACQVGYYPATGVSGPVIDLAPTRTNCM